MDFKVNYFTEDEYAELKKNKNLVLVDEKVLNKEKLSISLEIQAIYEETKAIYEKPCQNEICKHYSDTIEKLLSTTDMTKKYFEDIGRYEKRTHPVLGELDFFILPKDVELYKGTKYFYDKLPPKHFWVGNKAIAFRFALLNHGGMNVYKSTDEIALFVLNSSNLNKVYNRRSLDETLAQNCLGDGKNSIKEAMEFVYGCGISFNDHTSYICKKNPKWCNSIYIYNHHDVERENCMKIPYIRSVDKLTDLIHSYIYDTYQFQGTFLPYHISPYNEGGADEEININIKNCNSFQFDDANPLFWKNWGLKLPDPSKFMLNESYQNENFKSIEWYFRAEKVDKDRAEKVDKLKVENNNVRILSYNVRNFVSANALESEEFVFQKFLDLIDKLNPNIIAIEEFSLDYLNKLPACYKHKFFVHNGGGKNVLAVYTDHPSVFSKISFRDRTERNSILIKYKGLKIIATHLEIGQKYNNRLTGFIKPEEFANNYKSNVEVRTKQIKGLLEHSPDLLVGDFNFNPDDVEINIFKDLGYNYSTTPATSINGVKVDFVFSSPNFKGVEHAIEYYRSDHQPLIYDFNLSGVKKISGGDGDGQIIGSKYLVWIIILVILLMVLMFVFLPDIFVNVDYEDKIGNDFY